MTDAEKKVEGCLDKVRGRIKLVPRVALILGSGLGDFADTIQKKESIEYREIDGFPISTVPGHRGRFVFGYVGAVPVVAMQGRVHYYEGYKMSDVVLPVRLMARMGADILFLTNAAGGVSSKTSPGDFMILSDQISSFVPSPLAGENIDSYGVRFPSMNEIYDENLRKVIRKTAEECGIDIKEGVYVQTAGPAYESPAEVRMLEILGADAVGMSTAVEAVAAVHMGMKVCGISCISNMAGGAKGKPLSHEEVSRVADRMAPLFKELVRGSIENMAGRGA